MLIVPCCFLVSANKQIIITCSRMALAPNSFRWLLHLSDSHTLTWSSCLSAQAGLSTSLPQWIWLTDESYCLFFPDEFKRCPLGITRTAMRKAQSCPAQRKDPANLPGEAPPELLSEHLPCPCGNDHPWHSTDLLSRPWMGLQGWQHTGSTEPSQRNPPTGALELRRLQPGEQCFVKGWFLCSPFFSMVAIWLFPPSPLISTHLFADHQHAVFSNLGGK